MVNAEHVRRALDAFEHGSDRRYFFQKIQLPDWISPLKDEGVFVGPPEPVYSGEYVSYPDWPEGQYLLRMAEKTDEASIQRLILDIILEIPSTKNARAKRVLAEIALQLPPQMAFEWAKKERKRLEEEVKVSSLHADVLGKLVVHVASERPKFALHTMRELLRLFPDEDYDSRPFGLPQPKPRMEQYRYGEVVESRIPELVELSGTEALDVLLCPLLEDLISHSFEESNEAVDYSSIWRPAIEGEGRRSVRDSLVNSLRDAAEQLAKGPAGPLEVVRILEKQMPLRPLFRRVALHVLRTNSDRAKEEIATHLKDPGLLRSSHAWHEYALLLKDTFADLSTGDQQFIIDNILDGPQLEEDPTSELSDNEIEEREDRWILKRLTLIEKHLADDAKEAYWTLRQQYGAYENPEGGESVSTGWVGPRTPKTPEELTELSPENALQFIAQWKPSGEWLADSPEGLGRAFTTAVKENAAEYASVALTVRDLDPTYVRAYISGLEDSDGDFDWDPVLKLCEWIVNQPREPQDRQIAPSGHMDIDPDWGWTRKRIASLLRKGLGSGRVPFKMRDRVWGIIEVLTKDPEPTPEYEAKYGGDNMNPLALSINTVRGEALHAVVQYALWVRRNVLDEDQQAKPTSDGFNEMPEVRDMLEYHLDLQNEPSMTARAVYGARLPQLFLIDSTWTRANRVKIFPPKREEYRTTTWDWYVQRNPPYSDVYEAFKIEYEAAIERLEYASGDNRSPQQRLAAHLMALYLRGRITLNESDLIVKFFDKADGELRGYALNWVGESLRQSLPSTEAGGEVIARLHELWEYRLEAAKSSDTSTHFESEMVAFGSWLASERLDAEYSLRQASEALSISGYLRPDFVVLEALAKLSDSYPALSLECLQLIVYGASQWKTYGSRKETRTILENALDVEEDEVREKARDLIQYMGTQGFFQFRDLLKR